MAAIPTKYGGIQFRSRLEARWAAFFDILGWTWDYEPIDCDGWIPDFVLHTSPRTLVEVKPVWDFDSDVAAKMERGAGVRPEELLLIGNGPLRHEGETVNGAPSLGWLGDKDWVSETGAQWNRAVFCGPNEGRVGFASNNHSYRDRISNLGNGDQHLPFNAHHARVYDAWRTAGNCVQWRKPR